MLPESRIYVSNRQSIANALAELLKTINGSEGFNTNLGTNVYSKIKFWDEVEEFPAVHLAPGTEARVYQAGGYKDRYLSITIRCYVNSEESQEELEGLLADIEFVIEENGRLAYQDRSGVPHTTHDITISSIDTDEGVLSPMGVGEILLQVRY